MKIERHDLIKTVDGLILLVSHASINYITGIDVTNHTMFLSERKELESKIMEVVYV